MERASALEQVEGEGAIKGVTGHAKRLKEESDKEGGCVRERRTW